MIENSSEERRGEREKREKHKMIDRDAKRKKKEKKKGIKENVKMKYGSTIAERHRLTPFTSFRDIPQEGFGNSHSARSALTRPFDGSFFPFSSS